MRLIPLALAFPFLFLQSKAAVLDEVVILSRRAGWIEVLDPETLATISLIRVPPFTESVAPDPSGRRLLMAAPGRSGQGCCALFALDLLSMHLLPLFEPAMRAVVAGDRIFTQRGNVGIDVFDGQSLSRLPSVKAPGVYRLQASPDGRLLFGTASWPEPSLDLFDAVNGVRLASRAFPGASNLSGVWVDQQYYLLARQSGSVGSVIRQYGSVRARPQPAALVACRGNRLRRSV